MISLFRTDIIRYFCGTVKTAVRIALLLFVAFLSTPTVVSLIERENDTSYFFSMNEEEQLSIKEIKEVKAELTLSVFQFIPEAKGTSDPIVSEFRLKHDNVTPSIFSPPPNV